MSQKPWTMKEIQFLKDNHKDLYLEEIAEQLGRTCDSVRSQLYRLGLKRKRQEYAIYKGDELILSGTVEELSEKMNVTKEYIHWMATPAASRKRNKIAVRI